MQTEIDAMRAELKAEAEPQAETVETKMERLLMNGWALSFETFKPEHSDDGIRYVLSVVGFSEGRTYHSKTISEALDDALKMAGLA